MSPELDTPADVADAERARLITGAWNVLARNGFDGFKVQLVARDAKLSARAFYRHFNGKDALLLALLEDEMRRSGVFLAAAVDRAADPEAKVEAWIAAVIGVLAHPSLAARARLFSTQQAAMRRFPGRVAESTRHLVRPLSAAIVKGRDAGVFPTAQGEHDATMIYRLTGAVMTERLANPDGAPLDEIVFATADFVLRALTAPLLLGPRSNKARPLRPGSDGTYR
jgi:AcrR family transcriptional regulator